GEAIKHQEDIEEEGIGFGYREVRFDTDFCGEIRVDPHGIIWAETDKIIRVGQCNNNNLEKAYEIINSYNS
ncbi:hypothetical protein KY334_05815, partial [Candidatus Woesearchaeota archaeon]|nr:hypothetical protein [Candidatus Woesearchaeota archaeon]